MAQSRDDWSLLVADLAELGLSVFGGLEIEAEDCPADRECFAGCYGMLIGNAGRDMWNVYSYSVEHKDNLPNSMDRWTRRVLTDLANRYRANPVFPFEKPYWPFQRFAKRAGHANSSPLGILIHPSYGLWHGFRAVLLFEENHTFASQIRDLAQKPEGLIHPCETCAEKPCLSSCPVDAFDGFSLKRETCRNHLDADQSPRCMKLGCRARDACPIGTEYRYETEQIQFHMQAFAK